MFLTKVKVFMVLVFLFLLLVVNTSAHAEDQFVLDGGLGLWNSGITEPAETKMLTFGLQKDLYNVFKQRYTVGGWADNTGNGRASSGLASGQLGFEVNKSGTVGSIFFGPCLITTPDSYLGGYFQFMTDFHLAIEDNKHNSIGVFYRHISSAGIEMPNVGRDIAGLEIKFP